MSPAALRPEAPLSGLIGGRTATKLSKELDLHTVQDLLRHYPRRYAERGQLTDLSGVPVDENVTVLARVSYVTTRRMRKRKGFVTEVHVTDGSHTLALTFFDNKGWRRNQLPVGKVGLFAGKVTPYRGPNRSMRGRGQLVHPEFRPLDDSGDLAAAHSAEALTAFAGALIPIYPATSKVRSWDIADSVRVVLDAAEMLPDLLPEKVRVHRDLLPLGAAVRAIHQPRDHREYEQARDRLRFDEAFVVQAELARRRHRTSGTPAVPRRSRVDGALAEFDAALPFTLTDGQRRVGEQIAAEIARDHPMNRLLQGEVGSGKTVVALRAMLTVVDAGGQAVLLAPTEVLAHQHHRSLTTLLGPLARAGMIDAADDATRVALITGSMSARVARQELLEVASGQAGIVVGTHALLEEHVQFQDLGLVVIDEQHRFGVDQRAALSTKVTDGVRPHVLVMTATPIPRTVAMTVFGDLDISTMEEVPAGRAEVGTHVVQASVKPHFFERVWKRVREEIEAGRRVYVVCPRIGADDEPAYQPPHVRGSAGGSTEPDGGTAALSLAAWMRSGPLQGIDVGVLHGRMTSEDKDATVAAFESGSVPCLVSTTVVEVGVDVTAASTMVIMDAERFGVSQLHQLRGRIGRGNQPGVCMLVTAIDEPSPALQRLEAIAGTRNGFEIAKVDLEQRREGDVLGTSQSGRRSSLRLLSVLRHEDVIRAARDHAEAVIADDPDCTRHPELARALEAFGERDEAEYMDRV